MTEHVEPGRVLALFRVGGRARTKGSLNAYCTKGPTHRIRVEEQTKDSSLWRRQVAHACQRHQLHVWGRLLGHSGPVEVWLVVYLPRELSTAQGAPEGTVIPSHQTPYPTDVHLGDGDKFARNIGDALQDSRLIRDDAQITDWHVAKRWCPGVGGDGWVEIMVTQSPEEPEAPVWMPEIPQ